MRAIYVVFLAALAASCSKGGHGSGTLAPNATDQAPTDATVKSDTGGVLTATLDPTIPQKVSASATGALKGTTITVPAGALAVATDLTVQEGAALPLDAIKTALKVDASVTVTPASGTLLLSVPDGSSGELSKPATVSLPFTPAGGLLDSKLKPALLFQISCGAANGKTIVGFAAVTVQDGKAVFDITCFSGAYTIVMVPDDFNDTVTAASDLPPPAPAAATATTTTAPLSLTAHTPAAGTVALPATVTMTFSQKLDEHSAADNISVELNDADVPGTLAVKDNVATFTPKVSFLLGASYHVAIKSHLTSATSATLAADTGFDFTVKDGAWAAVPELSGTSGYLTSMSPIGGGRFGVAAGIGSNQPVAHLTVFDGTAWKTDEAYNFGQNMQNMTATGSLDGRFYAVASIGQSSTALTPTLHRVTPTLASDLPLVGTPANYTSLFSAPLGPQSALFVYQNQSDDSITARTITGETLGSSEVVATAGPANTYRSGHKLATNSAGQAALAYYQYDFTTSHGNIYVLKRDATGTWTSLTPNGTELMAADTTSTVSLGIDGAGKVAVFWCGTTACSARIHDGSWGTQADVSFATSSVSSLKLAAARDGGTYGLVWSRSASGPTYSFEAAVFNGKSWSAIKQLDTASISYFDTGMDGGGRIQVAWETGGNLYASRYDGTAWAAPTTVGTVAEPSSLYLGVDPSGQTMVMWIGSAGLDSYYFH